LAVRFGERGKAYFVSTPISAKVSTLGTLKINGSPSQGARDAGTG
jgi:hypothetical protein